MHVGNNPEIRTPRRAYEASGAIGNLELLRKAGLFAQVDIKLSNGTRGGNICTAIYRGSVDFYENREAIEKSLVLMPAPSYVLKQDGKIARHFGIGDKVPSLVVGNAPSELEMYLVAENSAGYDGLLAFRKYLLPGLLASGYNQPQSDEAVIFRLLAGGERPDSPIILCFANSGLTICSEKIEDGTVVLTKETIDNILGMYT